MSAHSLMDPVRCSAIRATKQALRLGTITKQPCEVCRRKRAEAHHDDYLKPLDIHWLCRRHHRERDAELKRIRATYRIINEPPPPKDARWARSELLRNGRPIQLQRPECRALIEAATLGLIDATTRRGISFNQVAKKAGIRRQQVSAALAGGIRTLATLASFAEAIDCTVHIEIRDREKSEAGAA